MNKKEDKQDKVKQTRWHVRVIWDTMPATVSIIEEDETSVDSDTL